MVDLGAASWADNAPHCSDKTVAMNIVLVVLAVRISLMWLTVLLLAKVAGVHE